MKKAIAILVLGSAFLASCGKYNYAPPLTEDQKKAKERIYGEVGGVAKQTKVTYPDDPNALARTAAVKEKLRQTAN